MEIAIQSLLRIVVYSFGLVARTLRRHGRNVPALFLFLDLTATVDDDAYFLAVLDRPGDRPFGGRLYVADHGVASSLKLRDELLLCERMRRRGGGGK
jgi:hypothetical protein